MLETRAGAAARRNPVRCARARRARTPPRCRRRRAASAARHAAPRRRETPRATPRTLMRPDQRGRSAYGARMAASRSPGVPSRTHFTPEIETSGDTGPATAAHAARPLALSSVAGIAITRKRIGNNAAVMMRRVVAASIALAMSSMLVIPNRSAVSARARTAATTALSGRREQERDLGAERGVLVGPSGEGVRVGAESALRSRLPDSAVVAAVRARADTALRFGITSIQDMASAIDTATTRRIITAASLPIRFRVIAMPATDDSASGRAAWAAVAGPVSPLVSISGVKWVLDGTPSNGSRPCARRTPTAAVARPDQRHGGADRGVPRPGGAGGEQPMLHASRARSRSCSTCSGDRRLPLAKAAASVSSTATACSPTWSPRASRDRRPSSCRTRRTS